MKITNKKTLIKYLVTIIIGIIATLGLLYGFNFFSGTLSTAGAMRALSDSFLATGVILMCICGLVFSSTEGMFDGLTYAVKIGMRALIPMIRKDTPQKYGDYKMAKSEKRLSGYSFLLFVGLGFTLIGIIFTVLYFVI